MSDEKIAEIARMAAKEAVDGVMAKLAEGGFRIIAETMLEIFMNTPVDRCAFIKPAFVPPKGNESINNEGKN